MILDWSRIVNGTVNNIYSNFFRFKADKFVQPVLLPILSVVSWQYRECHRNTTLNAAVELFWGSNQRYVMMAQMEIIIGAHYNRQGHANLGWHDNIYKVKYLWNNWVKKNAADASFRLLVGMNQVLCAYLPHTSKELPFLSSFCKSFVTLGLHD